SSHLDLHSFPTRRSSDLCNYRFFSKKSFSASIAVSSSSPSAEIVTVSPCFTPRDISIINWVSFFVFPSFVIVHSDENFFASFTRSEEHTSELQSRFDLVC